MTGVVLLTGATGFLGAVLATRLAERGERLHAVRRANSDERALAGLDVAWHVADLADGPAVERAVAAAAAEARDRGVELRVAHSGALISYRTRDREAQRLANIEGTRHVVEACVRHGASRLLHVSSIVAVAHSPSGELLDESAAFNGADLGVDYVTTKRAAEELALAAAARLDVVAVCPGAIFGPTTRASNSAELMRRIAAGRGPSLAPPGGTSVLGVEDAAEGCVLALERGRRGERYVLAERALSHFELMSAVAAHAGARPPRRRVSRALWPALRGTVALVDAVLPRRLVTPQALTMLALSWNLDAARARRELGWSPRPFPDVLASTLDTLLR